MIKKIPKKLWSIYRHEIANEIHRRPYLEMLSPLRVSCINLHSKNHDNNYFYLKELCNYLSLPEPNKDSLTYNYNYRNLFSVKWESHREFCTFQIIKNEPINNLFEKTNLEFVPQLWIDSLDSIINCVNLEVIDFNDKFNKFYLEDRLLYNAFDNNYIVGSYINSKKGNLFSDFRIDGNGYHRILIINKNMTTHQLGRSIQRILDVESYRSMAMISLFESKKINTELDYINNKLIEINSQIKNLNNTDIENNLLDLYKISYNTNKLDNNYKFRFQASNSYYPIIKERLNELKLEKIPDLYEYDLYLNSRLLPSERTSKKTEIRLSDTLYQIKRSSILFQTKIDLEVKNNSNLLLKSMNEKTDIQIKLQKTVESLSTVVLTYYTSSLFHYLLKGMNYNNILPIELLTSISIIPIGLFFYNFNKKINKF